MSEMKIDTMVAQERDLAVRRGRTPDGAAAFVRDFPAQLVGAPR